jgi:Uma2 family endonuclease
MAMELETLDYDVIEESEQEEMSNPEHSVIAANLIGELRPFLKGKQIGRVFDCSNEYRYLPKIIKGAKEQQPYRKPDVSFVSQERLPAKLRPYYEIAPDFAVEIASPTDRDFDIDTKVKEYQKYGVRLIWIIHPVSRSVDVYRLADGVKLQRYIENDELSGEDVIPGFKININDIFDFEPDPDPDLVF